LNPSTMSLVKEGMVKGKVMESRIVVALLLIMVTGNLRQTARFWCLYYCTISIYSVVTRHGRAYRNRNLVDVTGHRGSCRIHLWSRLLILSKIWCKKIHFSLIDLQKFSPEFICDLWPHAYQSKWTTYTSNIYPMYRKFSPVTAMRGAYRNAESTKRVTVTRSYRIDRNGTVQMIIYEIP
jgi:hypothetical protein